MFEWREFRFNWFVWKEIGLLERRELRVHLFVLNEIRCCWDGRGVGSRVFGVVRIAIRCCWDGRSVGSRVLVLLGMRLGVVGMEEVWGVGFVCVVGNEIRCC